MRSAKRQAVYAYKKAVALGRPSTRLKEEAREAYLEFGGDQDRASYSLRDYDHIRWGPFLGVSDEGSAVSALHTAALQSPKIRALRGRQKPSPLKIGLALDAERLGGIGEVAVGPDEYADVWLGCVERLLVTTNIGTRVNTRVYRREPRIVLNGATAKDIDTAKIEIAAAFRPFIDTPDGTPRPLTVFVDIPRYVNMTKTRKREVLLDLNKFVKSGQTAQPEKGYSGHILGLAVWARSGLDGKAAVLEAIELAASAAIEVVVIDGVKRKEADAAISLAGLLEYFAPGIVGPLLRAAKQKGVRLRASNLPDTDTIARSIWSGLTTARAMGAHLGKYGCFPLTLAETDRVVAHIQEWFPTWSASPVFFVDQGLLSDVSVDVERDLPRGIERWLRTIAAHGTQIVLIDTIDKPTGRRLLSKDSKDKLGYMSLRQVARIEKYAAKLGVRVLWAGGLGMRDAYEMGKLGVFGIYVTSAAATTIAVTNLYASDPALTGVKEPTKEGVLRAKTFLEAGFLSAKLSRDLAGLVSGAAENLLRVLESPGMPGLEASEKDLASACIEGWKKYWQTI